MMFDTSAFLHSDLVKNMHIVNFHQLSRNEAFLFSLLVLEALSNNYIAFRFEQMALRKVRSNLDRLFDKSLTDLIRGIRNNKENEV